MPEVAKEEKLGREKAVTLKALKQKIQNKFLFKSDLKERTKNKLFFSCDLKGKIPHQTFFQGQGNMQFNCQEIFLTPRNSLGVSIIGTDTFEYVIYAKKDKDFV